MANVIRNRTIRPSSRLESSKSYKIDTKNVSRGDTLIVNIDHEKKSFRKTYCFNGTDVESKDSISFRVKDYGTSIEVSWSGAQPSDNNRIFKEKMSFDQSNPQQGNEIRKPSLSKVTSNNHKVSFDPVSNSDTRILILGTMPGDKSLSENEYYAHPRNRFWKIISAFVNEPIPFSYDDKIKLLHTANIGIWDVANKAVRNGSLDKNLKGEEPNDLNGFITGHKKLNTIIFNGKKCELLFDKYFTRKENLRYYTLPSTSPANTGVNFEKIWEEWKKVLALK
jgi:hypoxanthine-DNA glycosylase